MGETTMRFLSSISRIFSGVNNFIFSRMSLKCVARDYSMLAAELSLACGVSAPK